MLKHNPYYSMLMMIKDVPMRIRDDVFDREFPLGLGSPLDPSFGSNFITFLVHRQEYWVIADIR